MNDLTYDRIAPILRACITPDNPEDPIPDKYIATRQLLDWVNTSLKSVGQQPTITEKIVFDFLRDALGELHQISLSESDEPGSAESYKLLHFLYYLLCKPPTQAGTILREFDISGEKLKEWLSDSFAGKDVQRVIDKVGPLLIDLCSQPEPPKKNIPVPPLKDFEDLIFLGGLRHVLANLYNFQPPKAAQSCYIPLLVKLLSDRFDSGSGGRAVIVAPTNSGKNGMILASGLSALAWDQGPVVVLQPYRAQISESVRTWNGSVLGIRINRKNRQEKTPLTVAGSSSTITEHDGEIVRGKIDLVSIVPEKLAVLSRQQSMTSICKLLICDEIAQLFSEDDRGPKLEVILTLAKIENLPILAFGAGLSDSAAQRVAGWIAELPPTSDARSTVNLIFDQNIQRDPPIEIRVIRIDGVQRFWKQGQSVFEPNPIDAPAFVEKGSVVTRDDEEDAVGELVFRELCADPDRQILVFLEARDRLARLADNIASRLAGDKDGLGATLDSIAADGDKPPLGEIWLGGSMPAGIEVRKVLASRVGIHTRDVPSNNLERIESAFREGRLRVLCATTTVEAGINLPVDTVIQVGLLDHNGRWLSQRKLEQRLGRSGRTLQKRNIPGRGIIFLPDSKLGIERVIEERVLRLDPKADSGMTPGFMALLLLSYLGATEGRSTSELWSVLSASY